MEFYFSGTGLKVIGMKANDTHTFDLYIDDQIVASDVDTNSSQTLRQQLLLEITDLEEGIHKVKLLVKFFLHSHLLVLRSYHQVM